MDIFVPFLKDWNKFSYDHTHGWRKFGDNFITFGGLSAWNSLNQYRQRILDIRQAAEAQGFELQSPQPAGPSVNMIELLARQAALASQEIWKVLKIVIIIGAIAIGVGLILYGLPAITKVVSSGGK
jgi:hypothetical protein